MPFLHAHRRRVPAQDFDSRVRVGVGFVAAVGAGKARLFNMSPPLSGADTDDCLFVNPEVGGYQPSSPVVASNRENLFYGELGVSIALAPRGSAVCVSILHVGLTATPHQMMTIDAQPVVAGQRGMARIKLVRHVLAGRQNEGDTVGLPLDTFPFHGPISLRVDCKWPQDTFLRIGGQCGFNERHRGAYSRRSGQRIRRAIEPQPSIVLATQTLRRCLRGAPIYRAVGVLSGRPALLTVVRHAEPLGVDRAPATFDRTRLEIFRHTDPHICSRAKEAAMKHIKPSGSVGQRGKDKALWSPSYFVGSCGGAPLSIIAEYVKSQREAPVGRSRLPPRPEGRGFSRGS